MSPINFQDFRTIADTRRDATLSVSQSTGNLQIRDNHVLNRLITWVRDKLSTPDPSKKYVERQAAYSRFLGAIGNDIRYRDQLGWLEGQLGADTYIKKPLTSRRVREIMNEMDTRTTEAHRNTLVTAHYMAGREGSNFFNNTLAEKLSGRPMLQDVHFDFSPDEREALSQKVYDAVMQAGDDGRNDIGYAEGSAVAERVINAELDAHEVGIINARTAARQTDGEAAQKARDIADAKAKEEAAKPRRQPVIESAADARTGQNAMPEARTSGAAQGVRNLLSRITRRSTGAATAIQTKDMLSELKKVDLPKDVKTDLKKSIKTGGIKSFDAFVKQTNEKTFKWICDNRFGKWYYDALKNSGARVGNEVTVPDDLVAQVEQKITRNAYLVGYADIKANVREDIAAYIAENGAGNNA